MIDYAFFIPGIYGSFGDWFGPFTSKYPLFVFATF